MKILYISQYFPPEMGAPSARAAELSQSWARDGHEVSVLTGFPNHPTGVVAPAYRSKLRRLFMREVVNDVQVNRTWLLPLPNRKPWERAINYVSFFFSSAFTGLFLERPDVVIGTSPQLLVALASWWIARCQGTQFIFEVRDLWPESLEAVGIGNQDSKLHRVLSGIANFLYRNSDHIVVVTAAFKSYLMEHRGVPADKISVVENGVDTRLFRPQADDSGLRKLIGCEEKFLVSYIGTMGMAQGLDTILEAAQLLKESHSNIAFLLVGEGADKEKLISHANSRGLTNVRFVDQQNRDRVPAYICSSNVCLVPLKRAEVFKTVLPTKLLEYMSCGRAVILGVDGEARRILVQSGAGLFVEPENARELAAAIVHLALNPTLRESLGQNGRNYILRQFSREQTALRYLDLMENVIGYAGEEIRAA